MHSINTNKLNDQLVRDILNRENIAYDVYDLPDTYSVVTVTVTLEITTIEALLPLVEPSTTFDWQKVSTDGSEEQNSKKFAIAYGKQLERGQ